MNNNQIYLFLMVATVFFPLLFSFEKRVAYFRSWKYLFPAMIITATVFLMWDTIFTKNGVWGFNPDYIHQVYFLHLPLEEILFFFAVPFASIFIYMFLNKFWPNAGLFDKFAQHITVVIIVVALAVAIFNTDKAYTLLNCCYAVIFLGLQLFVIKGTYMGRFYRFYLVHLIPFFIVNGILTGTGINGEVVWYNNEENLGIRLLTIPVEDTLYSMSLMLMNITLYEYFRDRRLAEFKLVCY